MVLPPGSRNVRVGVDVSAAAAARADQLRGSAGRVSAEPRSF